MTAAASHPRRGPESTSTVPVDAKFKGSSEKWSLDRVVAHLPFMYPLVAELMMTWWRYINDHLDDRKTKSLTRESPPSKNVLLVAS